MVFRHPCPHTHQQNRTTERKHRHIVDMGLALLAQVTVPLKFWSDVFIYFVYYINRLLTLSLELKCPFKVFFNHKPDYIFLKVFNISRFPFLRPHQSHKFSFRVSKMYFWDTIQLIRGYKYLHSSSRIYIARSVIFNESEFPILNCFPHNYLIFSKICQLVPQ